MIRFHRVRRFFYALEFTHCDCFPAAHTGWRMACSRGSSFAAYMCGSAAWLLPWSLGSYANLACFSYFGAPYRRLQILVCPLLPIDPSAAEPLPAMKFDFARRSTVRAAAK